MTDPGATNADGSVSGTETSNAGSGVGVTGSDSVSNPDSVPGSGSQAMMPDGSWLAGLAMGDATRVYYSSSTPLNYAVLIVLFIFC